MAYIELNEGTEPVGPEQSRSKGKVLVVALVAVIAIVAIASILILTQGDDDGWREIDATDMPPYKDGTYHYKGVLEWGDPELEVFRSSEADITFQGGFMTEIAAFNMTNHYTNNLPDVVYEKEGPRFTQVGGHSWDTTIYQCGSYEFTIANGLPVHVVYQGKYGNMDLVMSDWFY